MRFSRMQGVLTAAALLAALPAHGQAAAPPAAPSLTPPGSMTPVPLLPGPTTPGPGGAVAAPGFALPSTPLNTPGMYPGLGFGGAPGPSSGAGPDLSSVLSGSSSLPLSLSLGQLDGNWRRMTVTGTFDLGSVTQAVGSLLGSAGIGVYYTKGQTVTVGETTYLVAYRSQPQMLTLAGLMMMVQNAETAGKPPPAEVLTAKTPLALSLLNLTTTGSLTDIRAFDLTRELADSAAAVHAYNTMVDMMAAAAMKAASPARPEPRKRPAA